MSASLTLSQLVDLALGTPEVGSVNFNVLHSLLHTMIQKLGIGDVKTEIPKSDRDFLTRRRDEPDAFSSAGTDVSDKDSAITGFTDDSSRKAPYHQLEDKVAKLEKQFQELHELPTNRDLYERAKLKGEGERPTPVSDMWQTMQLKNRVDANEAGIGKLMSLVQDLMSDMQRLKDDMQTLKDENKEIRNRLDDVKDMNELLKRLKDLEDLSKSLEDKIKGLPGPEAFNDYVSWAALEDALRGLREGLDELNSREPPAPPAPAERIVIEMSSQTTPRSSRPNSSRPASARGPSEELQHLLEKLGKLTDRHDKLEDRVDVIEDELKKKLDKSALEGLNLGVPDEVLQKLKALQEEIDKLKKNLGRDSEAFSRMQQNLANLQFELARLDKITHRLVDQNTSQQNSLDELYKLCSQLDEHKANKEFVQTEVDVKADKKLVDGKVNRSLFDSTCEDINKMIQDILAKLAASDEDWQRMRNQLTEDLDGKLDRLEFGPIRDELERQLRALAKRLKDMNRDYDYLEDDAAGIRKQLVQRFHCISCDRPVDMMPQGPVPSLPSPNGLPATRSARPYTTFELEQIRQHAKSLFTYQEKLPIYATSVSQPNAEMIDAYQTSRACGGNHTLTYPHRRTARATHLNADQPVTSSEQQKQTEKFWSRKSNLFRDDTEVTVIPTYKNEIDIQGADGHIYRGRGGLPKLPPGSASSGMAKNPPMLPHRAQTSLGEAGRNTPPPASPRPTSARNSRPMSARHSPSPNAQPSSQPMVQLPRDEEAPRPPPAPSPSEPDNTSAPVE